MNTLCVDSYIHEINDYEGLVNLPLETKLTLSGNNKILITSDIKKLKIKALDNSINNIYIFIKDKVNNLELKVKQYNNSKINITYLFDNKEDIKDTLKNKIKGNNNHFNITIRCLSKEKIDISLFSVIYENTNNNVLYQNAKGMLDKGSIKIDPNIEVNSMEVIADHGVSIKYPDKEELLYLTSKGLSLEESILIIKNGFILNSLCDEYKEYIRKEYYE